MDSRAKEKLVAALMRLGDEQLKIMQEWMKIVQAYNKRHR